jgi:hypothetical protein
MLERVNLQQYIDLADSPEIRTALPGKSLDERLRAFAGNVVLQDGPEIAIFQHRMLRVYTAVVFDFEHDTSFPWEVMHHMFCELEVYNPGNDSWSLEPADSLMLFSASRDAGDRYRAAFAGTQFNARSPCVWDLQRDQFLQAVRPVRPEERVEVPRPLNGQERKAARKLIQAEVR